MTRLRPLALALRTAAIAGAAALFAIAPASTAQQKFYEDDPITREPDTQDASGAQGRDIDLLWDIAGNLFARQGDTTQDVRARNVNSIDEVPDSSWFTNRVLAHPLSADEVARGPVTGAGPAPGTWTIVAPKRSGASPGFTMRDAKNGLWFVSLDGNGDPEAATGAVLVANKLFWALGYWQIENHLAIVRPESLQIASTATFDPVSGVRRKMTRDDLEAILRRAHRSADGSYRAVAARAIEGRPIEGFYYYGTRSDDPNDIVPHEHRRELRALKVFGAWTNLVDMKAGNTLDSVVQQNGRGVVRHYLQDVGSTFGSGANGPHDYFEGWEYLFESAPTMRRLLTFGFALEPWQTAKYETHPAVGRFEGDAFDPAKWKPRAPTAAFLHARADDNFWAARRVMAFSDEMIRAATATGQYSNSASAQHLATVLIKRRDAIGRTFLPAVNPISEPRLDNSGVLTFQNPAVAAGFAKAPSGYQARWLAFDNVTGDTRAIGETTGKDMQLPAVSGLPSSEGTYVRVEITASGGQESWNRPVHAYFRRVSGAWRLVGFERLPQN